MTSLTAEQEVLTFTDEGTVRRWFSGTVRFIRLQPLGAFGIVIILLVAAAAIFAPNLNTVDPRTRIPNATREDVIAPPSGEHWLGTNRGAFDMWSRVVYGARPALMIGAGAVGIAMVMAVALSLAAGYMKGVMDLAISRLIEIIVSVPGLVWLILFTTAFDPSVQVLMFAIAFSFAPLTTLVLRGSVIQESASTYAESARVVGASNLRIMLRHILPNILPLAIVNASIIIPAAILAEAGLSFLGLGLEQGTPSWGVDLGPIAQRDFVSGWWLPVFPGLALSLTVLAFNFLGDSLRDVLDPRLRGSGLI